MYGLNDNLLIFIGSALLCDFFMGILIFFINLQVALNIALFAQLEHFLINCRFWVLVHTRKRVIQIPSFKASNKVFLFENLFYLVTQFKSLKHVFFLFS